MSLQKIRILVLVLLFSLVTQASMLTTNMQEKSTASPVKGSFSQGGMVLTITSQAEFEELWVLQVAYCDGTGESLGRHSYRIKFRAPISEAPYTFYASKPIKRVTIASLPIEGPIAAPNLRYTEARRRCETAESPPKLYCNNVQVSPEIHRVWEGVPVSFNSNRHVVFTGMKFPGVDGLAPARVAEFGPNRYAPSLSFDTSAHTWSGTFISSGVPAGEYKNVALVVRDDFGQQAKCLAGNITVLP